MNAHKNNRSVTFSAGIGKNARILLNTDKRLGTRQPATFIAKPLGRQDWHFGAAYLDVIRARLASAADSLSNGFDVISCTKPSLSIRTLVGKLATRYCIVAI